MLTIGEFASIGRVSVRMLRHYDEIGLLRPAQVDPVTGYRYYEASQFAVLSRIIGLKNLGLSLDQVTRVADGGARSEELEGMLTVVRKELRRSLERETARLDGIEAMLRTIRGEETMTSEISVEVRAVAAQTVATLTRRAPGSGPENVSPVIGPMFPESAGLIAAAGITDFGPAIAVYNADESGDGNGVFVTAGFVVPADTVDLPGLDVHELPAIEQAAVTVHHGEVAGIGRSWAALGEWVHENGYELIDVCREVYWTPGDQPQSEWVTDLVQPVKRAR
jgi:DNA-binding transcriptional MerR regulator/effector-binding domain-containing protein